MGVTANGAIILAAGGIVTLLQRKLTWMRWQKWITGTILGAIGLKLAIDARARARPATNASAVTCAYSRRTDSVYSS